MLDLDHARNLDYYEVIFDDIEVVRELDMLLRRMFGSDIVKIIASRSKTDEKVWIAYFWATKEEFDVIRDKMDELANQRLDEEYETLIREMAF